MSKSKVTLTYKSLLDKTRELSPSRRGPACRVCTCSLREQVDEAIRGGASDRAIAAVSDGVLKWWHIGNHRQNHMRPK